MPILTPTEQLRRVMVCRTDGLGDVIVTLPIAVALRERLPDVEIVYMVSPATAPLLRRIGEIDNVVTVSGGRRALHVMKITAPDAILFARPELRLALDAVLARIDVRIGTGYRWFSGLFTRWVYEHRKHGEKHEAEYGVNLLSPLLEGPLPVRMPRLEQSGPGWREAASALRTSTVDGPYVVVHAGSHGSAASYPPDLLASVISNVLERVPALAVILSAGPGEEGLVNGVREAAIASGSPRERVVVVAGLTLDGFSELLRNAGGFVGVSSGPAHLAALVGAPTVALYPGLPPMWPVRWRPLGDDVETLTPNADEPECPNCGRGHRPENCVARIRPERVAGALANRLRRSGPGGHLSQSELFAQGIKPE